jgi:hypothetical protein
MKRITGKTISTTSMAIAVAITFFWQPCLRTGEAI